MTKWISVSAFGSWHPSVPKGMVGLVCKPNGDRNTNAPERSFLVPLEDYKNPSLKTPLGFCCDPPPDPSHPYEEIEALGFASRDEPHLPTEIEKHYQAYWHRGTQEALAEVILGSDVYTRRFRMPKRNITVNMLMEPKVAIKYWHVLDLPTSKSAHAQRSEYFKGVADVLHTAYVEHIRRCEASYGDHGPLVSGVVRSHFPPEAKGRLRFLKDAYQMASDASKLHEALTKTRSPVFTW